MVEFKAGNIYLFLAAVFSPIVVSVQLDSFQCEANSGQSNVCSKKSVPSAVVYYYCAWYTFFGIDINYRIFKDAGQSFIYAGSQQLKKFCLIALPTCCASHGLCRLLFLYQSKCCFFQNWINVPSFQSYVEKCWSADELNPPKLKETISFNIFFSFWKKRRRRLPFFSASFFPKQQACPCLFIQILSR